MALHHVLILIYPTPTSQSIANTFLFPVRSLTQTVQLPYLEPTLLLHKTAHICFYQYSTPSRTLTATLGSLGDPQMRSRISNHMLNALSEPTYT